MFRAPSYFVTVGWGRGGGAGETLPGSSMCNGTREGPALPPSIPGDWQSVWGAGGDRAGRQMCISFSTALKNILMRDGVKNTNSRGCWGPNPGPLLIALEIALKLPALQASCTETAVERL